MIAEQPVSLPTRTWADKLIDFVVGEGPGTKYALICSYCHGHNGLTTLEDFDTKQFICLYCRHWNKTRCTIRDIEPISKLEVHLQDAERLKLSNGLSEIQGTELMTLPTDPDQNSSSKTE